ncbi:hypothetical protein [Neobacillus massiliamazoniensis]|uniref:Uncharacterized protein n=1 Tax=Neobacillus massiliamazoniensis TaxID=1499688 RepID=A0A0U1NYJ0_9BACI|nr:hypothetical protein [Neobacillus massiliamazoniensis]CRK83037.1 hypothetical protein BN000_02992 [Neobacillus massiliamazoniensis]
MLRKIRNNENIESQKVLDEFFDEIKDLYSGYLYRGDGLINPSPFLN